MIVIRGTLVRLKLAPYCRRTCAYQLPPCAYQLPQCIQALTNPAAPTLGDDPLALAAYPQRAQTKCAIVTLAGRTDQDTTKAMRAAGRKSA